MKIAFKSSIHGGGHGGHSTHIATRKVATHKTYHSAHGPLLPQNNTPQDSSPTQEDHSLKYLAGATAIAVAIGTGAYLHKLGRRPQG